MWWDVEFDFVSVRRLDVWLDCVLDVWDCGSGRIGRWMYRGLCAPLMVVWWDPLIVNMSVCDGVCV